MRERGRERERVGTKKLKEALRDFEQLSHQESEVERAEERGRESKFCGLKIHRN